MTPLSNRFVLNGSKPVRAPIPCTATDCSLVSVADILRLVPRAAMLWTAAALTLVMIAC
jgi:hypothetical protein